MNKQELLEKRYIVRLLGLILEGGKSNKEIAEKLGKGTSTIHLQLEYLEAQKIIYKEPIKNDPHNRKEYWINGEKLSELFLKYIGDRRDIKGVLKFKNNLWIILSLNWIISAHLHKEDVVETSLKQIFEKTYEYFLINSKDMKIDKDRFSKLMKHYTGEDKESTEKEFKLFLENLYKNAESI
ncbi:MAG TPA: hypothetical protein P5277_01260 [Candidatus Paceibacterota bacterium]|nr:hypothetical protein [Candidatus Paceibacterota bacterium]